MTRTITSIKDKIEAEHSDGPGLPDLREKEKDCVSPINCGNKAKYGLSNKKKYCMDCWRMKAE